MELSEDILQDYFFNRCTPDVAEKVQQTLAAGDSESVDCAMRGLLDRLEQNPKMDPDYIRGAYLSFVAEVEKYRRHRRRERMRHFGRRLVRVAAMLTLPLAIALSWLLVRGDAQGTEWLDITVPAGECSVVQLSDGSTLHVNAGSRVIYPSRFDGKERKIFLTGELFADVAKDAEHPFIVSVGDVSVQVLGTRFNLRAYENAENIEVALVEGSVLFKPSLLEGAVLLPGELIQYHRPTRSLIRDNFDIDGYLCPSMGTGFYFNNLPFGDIVVLLEQNFNVSIDVDDKHLLERTYTAYFSNGEDVDEILSKINNSGQMFIDRQEREIFITSAAKNVKK